MRRKAVLGAAVTAVLVGGMVAGVVEPASAVPNQTCRVVGAL